MFQRHASKVATLSQASMLGFYALLSPLQAAAGYSQENLVSDVPGLAQHADVNLVNPWGISFSPTGPFWVSNNHSGNSTLYNSSGSPQSLVVTVPPPAGGTPPSAPTGQVFNGGSSFEVGPNQPARFIFATEDGTISGWNPVANQTNAILKVDNSGTGEVYKGLAIDVDGATNHLYAADFAKGKIDVFDGTFTHVSLSGSFTDPNLPSGYAPFNVQNIGGQLLVAFAQQDPLNFPDEKAGPGLGIVDQFDTNGNLVKRLITGGVLNAPWGFALAPADFGQYSNDLLVGNFGDGKINAFDPVSGAYQGTLEDIYGHPIVIDGLWGLTFGNGGSGGARNKLYFTAGINDEANGLFGSLTVPEPGSLSLIGIGLAGFAFGRCRFSSQIQS